MLPRVIMRMTVIRGFWPMRCARSVARSSAAGFHHESEVDDRVRTDEIQSGNRPL